ncbi:MAG: PepSY domain-containing protein [Luteolibacter sp.]
MVHPTLRRCLFWAHLATGVVAGLVILILAVTGILMSFETQIIGRAESKIVTAKAPRYRHSCGS